MTQLGLLMVKPGAAQHQTCNQTTTSFEKTQLLQVQSPRLNIKNSCNFSNGRWLANFDLCNLCRCAWRKNKREFGWFVIIEVA
jgi:hypothetical protein